MKTMLGNMKTRTNLVTYLVVIAAFVLMQVFNSLGMLSSSQRGYLVPVCVYISLAVSLNLLVSATRKTQVSPAAFQPTLSPSSQSMKPSMTVPVQPEAMK